MPHRVDLSAEHIEVRDLWRKAIQAIQRETAVRHQLEAWKEAHKHVERGPAYYEGVERLEEALDHEGLMVTGALLDLDDSILDRAVQRHEARMAARAAEGNPPTGAR